MIFLFLPKVYTGKKESLLSEFSYCGRSLGQGNGMLKGVSRLFNTNSSQKFWWVKISSLVLYFKNFWIEVDIPTCLSYFCWKGITNFL